MSLTNDFINTLYDLPQLQYQIPLINNPLSSLTKNNTIINSNPFYFNNEIKFKYPITDQKSSGRCWAFAALNLVRIIASQNWKENYEVDDLEFSQNYFYFWEKMERYNYNLRTFLDVNKLSDNTIYMLTLFDKPMSDGGHWNMAKDIISKYGIVPKHVMPDSYHSRSSAEMNTILNTQLKQDFITLSKSDSSIHETLIETMLTRVYQMLVGFLGKPPKSFDYTFKNKDKIEIWKDITPRDLLIKTKFNPEDWVGVFHDPRKENMYGKYYEAEYVGNIYGKYVGWINAPIDRLRELTKASIDKKQPVWFGCDVRASGDKETGIHDINIHSLKSFMNYNVSLTKEERLRHRVSVPNHAMVFVGYHIDDDKIKRWKVENSWGKSSGKDGFKLMTDEWFTEYVYEVIINKEHLTEEEKNAFNKTKVILKPWDPAL